MDRLTKKWGEKTFLPDIPLPDPRTVKSQIQLEEIHQNRRRIEEQIIRLSEYEDSGLLPEDVKRLADGKAIYEAYDGSKLDKADQYIERLEAENKIYKQHWNDLCDQIAAEIDKDGWCRLVITEKQLAEMKTLFGS